MEQGPARQQHDLDRHYRYRAPRHLTPQRQHDPSEDIAVPRAAARQDRRPGPLHVSRVQRVADRLQREICFDRRVQIGGAAEEQRPAAIWTLNRSEVARDALFEVGVDRAEIMLQQNVFGRDRRIRLKFEDPIAVAVLQREQRLDRSGDRRIERRRLQGLAQHRRFVGLGRDPAGHGSARWHSSVGAEEGASRLAPNFGIGAGMRLPLIRAAAARPERIAPSIVAGKSVST